MNPSSRHRFTRRGGKGGGAHPRPKGAPKLQKLLLADDLHRVAALERRDGYGAAGDVLEQAFVERFPFVLRVVTLGQVQLDVDELEADDLEAAGLQATQDGSDETALDTVGFDDDQGA